MNLIIMGPQGSGKGTQAKMLSEEYKMPQLSIGQLYRENIQKKTPVGKRAEKYVLSGKLVPLKLTEELLKKELNKAKYKKGFILDGFPRNEEQAVFLRKIVNIDYIIVINIPQTETIKRLSGRRICDCGETYNINVKKPKKDNLCDKCGNKIHQRRDDYPEAIKARLRIYRQDTKSVLDYYRKRKKVIIIDGKGSIKQINKRIINGLKEKGL